MRLSLLPSLTALALGVTLFTASPTSAAPEVPKPNDVFIPNLRCKCLPHEPCWPNTGTWNDFNSTVNGNLIATTPVARVCHGENYNKDMCDNVTKNYYFDHWRQLQPGAVVRANWETFRGEGCLLKQTAPCLQGAVPLYTVKATTIDHVKATVNFAEKHNIRLVVKNTGHDYLGRSMANSSLSLWTIHMKGIEFRKFVPEGAPSNTEGIDAVILGAGVLWDEANLEAHKVGRMIVGGAHPTVGTSGGFCQGGGHGPLSPLYGLCADNVLQYKVVTANGEERIANAYTNTDLFWALRGGGPSYGVVVQAVYRTHPAATFNVVTANITAPNEETMVNIMETFYAQQIKLSDARWGGYSLVGSKKLEFAFHLANTTAETAKNSFKSFFDAVKAMEGVQVLKESYSPPLPYYVFRKLAAAALPKENAGTSLIMGTRLIPRTLFESTEGPKKLATTMSQIMTDTKGFTRDYISMLIAGGMVAKANATETSVNPAWREALTFQVVPGGWLDTTPWETQKVIRRTLTKSINRLRELTPGGGTYMNEADPNEPNFQQNFFGVHYRTLYNIKYKYDPTGLFYCRRCVGSEDWGPKAVCPYCRKNRKSELRCAPRRAAAEDI
ncbi:hypothetical protein DFQ27_004540 [Actinomortierella ambigua]|uniref:FAD-binding PCMH-type domain-containing protein n=1 Tax=Actinomortierella ambigua TaxID=1343610 RepID=A0A9P6U3Z5_9FUNG|nr:hypothetical protein DFQ27_004540 [Actinomortierella ambigua]